MSACKVINAAERDDEAKITKRDFENAKKHMKCCFAVLRSINGEYSLCLHISARLSVFSSRHVFLVFSPQCLVCVQDAGFTHDHTHTQVCFPL